MNTKSQPWIMNAYADFFGLFLVPFLFIFLAFIKSPPFDSPNSKFLGFCILLVLIIDWAHIFAQYPRIFSNPLESKLNKWLYPLSYLLLLPVMTILLNIFSVTFIDTLLVYFVIFHFIKQHFGFVKIFSRTDGPKSIWEKRFEDLFIYLTMWAPVIYWHAVPFGYDYKWVSLFIKIPGIEFISIMVFVIYAFSFLNYIRMEFVRFKKDHFFNIPKNLSLLSAILGWGIVSILSDSTSLVIFTVTLTHDLSYTYLVWVIGRRDKKILNQKLKIFSWNSIGGFIFYVLCLVLISHIIMITHLELTKDLNWNYLIYGKMFNFLKSDNQWLTNFGWSLFFATQAHHYFIDRFLWKKEKDLEYMVKTGKYSLS